MKYASEIMKSDWSDWRLVLFTDEKSLWQGSGSTNTWQQLNHRTVEEFEKYTPKLHVWGSIGYYFKTLLFEQKMNAGLSQTLGRLDAGPTSTVLRLQASKDRL